MAVDTGCDARIPGDVLLAVHACEVFGVLVHSGLGIITAHVVQLAVARGAEGGDLLACRPADVTLGAAHRILGPACIDAHRGIPAMAVMAGKAFLKVNVGAGLPDRFRELRLHFPVTLDAGGRAAFCGRLLRRGSEKEGKHQQQHEVSSYVK